MLFGLITVNNSDDASSLSYQSNIDIGFTFLPTLNVSLSSDSLTINNLIPGGNAADSNTITINVSTNIAEGYNLYTTVGSSTNNTTNLINTSDNNYTFTPLSSNIPNLNSFTNNNWGYSYSNDSGATWISGDYDNAGNGYNGLPLYTNTGIKLVEEADNTSSTVDFKIAAKAGSTQPSGEYTNTINFTAVSNTIPTTMLDAFIASDAQMFKGYFKMQDMTPTICSSIDTDGEKGMQLIDVRDDKVYWVAKLKDNNCWMTQNLELDLVANSTILNSANTDIDVESYNPDSGAYSPTGGYSKDDSTNIVTWSPERSTTASLGNGNFPSTAEANNTPYSYNPGDKYYYPSSSGDDHPYTLSLCEAQGYQECQHSTADNYYKWSAAGASNNTSSLANSNRSADNSICPKGWVLPDGFLNSDFDILGTAYNITNNTALDLRFPPLHFVRSGSILGDRLYAPGNDTHYWTSLPADNSFAINLLFNSSKFAPHNMNGRYFGFSIRCIAE